MKFRRKRSQDDFGQEIASHLQLEIDRLIEEGMPAHEAASTARRRFGNITSARERFYESARVLWLHNLWSDLKYAARALRRQPVLVTVACLSLALGTGLNTAFFAIIDSLLLRPVTVQSPESLAILWVGSANRISEANYRSLQESGFSLAGYRMHGDLRLQTEGEAVLVTAQEVSPNYFHLLGIPVAHGLRLTPELLKTNPNAAVVTDAFWRDRLNGEFAAIGRTIRISGKSYTVVGVTPPGLRSIWGGGISPQVYFATGSGLSPSSPNRDSLRYELIGRLSSGESMPQFHHRMLSAAKGLAEAFPNENRDLGRVKIWAFPKYGLLMREDSGMFAPVVLFATVLFVLLGLVVAIACANIASMMLARAMNRQREIAVRLAIGCGRWRLMQLLFAESFVLSIAGAALGAALGIWLAHAAFRVPLPFPVPFDVNVTLNWHFFGYVLAMAVFATFAAGLAPVWQARRLRPLAGLHGDHVKGGRQGWLNLRSVLVMAQVTTATVLLAASGLFVRSLWRSTQVHPGFDLHHIATIDLDLRGADIPRAQAARFERQALQRILAVPGVTSASAVAILPLSMNSRITSLEVQGDQNTSALAVRNNTVAPDYFRTMRIAILQGREFAQDDVASSAPVAVVNQAFARQILGGADAVGRKIRRPNNRSPEPWTTIVGVAADSRYSTLGEQPAPVVYWLRTTDRPENMTLVARTHAAPDMLIPALRSAIREVDARVSSQVRPMRSVLTLALFPARAAAVILGILAVVALALSITGIYGLIAYTVTRRTSEIGVRMALGATRQAVIRLVVSDGLRIAVAGLAAGVLLALAGGRVLNSLLVGISSADPISFTIAAGILLGAAIAASYIPARKAARIDPVRSLREE